MKKARLLLVAALMLSAILLLSSCTGLFQPKPLDVKDIIQADPNADFNSAVYTQSSSLPELTGMTLQNSFGELHYFTGSEKVENSIYTYTKHAVYNSKLGSVVFMSTDSSNQVSQITLPSDLSQVSYYTVKAISYNLDELGNRSGIASMTTRLCDPTGANVTEAQGSGTVRTTYDLIHFNGACYRVNESGNITYAFDYSPLAALPSIDTASNEHYYEFFSEDGVNYLNVYNLDLTLCLEYEFPSYANGVQFTVLGNGNVLTQYALAEEEDAKDYTFMTSGLSYYGGGVQKYTLVTEIIDITNGKAKSIDCDYLFGMTYNLRFDDEAVGFNTEKAPVIGSGIKIEDKRIAPETDSALFVVIDDKGGIKELSNVRGHRVENIEYVYNNRWTLDTDTNTYLVNENGDVLGDITRANYFGNRMYADGKIYDYDLNVVFDYAGQGYALYTELNDALVLKNADGDQFIFSDTSTTPVCILDATLGYDIQTYENNYYSIKNISDPLNIKYSIYSIDGSLLLEITGTDMISALLPYGFEEVLAEEDTVLIRTRSAEGENIYYVLK